MINCKKLRFYNRFTVDFTVVGGQIGCPYFTVIFFFYSVWTSNDNPIISNSVTIIDRFGHVTLFATKRQPAITRIRAKEVILG